MTRSHSGIKRVTLEIGSLLFIFDVKYQTCTLVSPLESTTLTLNALQEQLQIAYKQKTGKDLPTRGPSPIQMSDYMKGYGI